MVLSIKRHWPSADLIETDEKARVAVSSRGLASAAADELRTPPALETETTDAEGIVVVTAIADVLGATVIDDATSVVVAEAGGGALVASALVAAALVEAAGSLGSAATSPKLNV